MKRHQDSAVRICGNPFCGAAFTVPPHGSGQPKVYCSVGCRNLMRQLMQFGTALADCPRCGEHDMYLDIDGFACCATCGYLPDDPLRSCGRIAQRGEGRNKSIKKSLAQAVNAYEVKQ